jgi:alkylhydroperoxidase family enzyme
VIALVRDGDESHLSDRHRLATRLTDVLVTDPHGMTEDLRAELAAEFPPEDLVELALTIAMASAFSRAAIAWGPPQAIPVMEVPTPA